MRALTSSGIEHTFAIQELTLPLAFAGEDIIGQARTGMGKTLGFGVPLLQRLHLPGPGTPQALVVVPTRELCLQVTRDLTEAGKHLDLRVGAIYGGRPYDSQIEMLRTGVDIIVGTPGRLLDLAEQRHLVLGKVQALVLDEADEMLDLGFLPDIERILHMVPEQRQTLLFSATMPEAILTLARTFLNHPTHIHAEQNDAGAVHERTRQLVYRSHSLDKPELIAKVLQAEGRGATMIFTRTKRTTQNVADDLTKRGFATGAVHGDLGQGAREQALRAFRSGKVDVLVATDIAARGIDVEDVTHVINYQAPEDAKTYVHRIGRTGRAGKAGIAITLVDWDEVPRWKLISDDLELGLSEPVETYSTSQHLFTDLAIPENAPTQLPKAERKRSGLAAEPQEDLGGQRERSRSSSRPPRTRSNSRRSRRPRKRTRQGVDVRDTGSETQPEQRDGDESGNRPSRRRTRRTNSDQNGPTDEKTGTTTDTNRPTRRRRRRRRGGEITNSTSNSGEGTLET